MNNRLVPTEEYPKILYYIEKRIPSTDDERAVIYLKHFNNELFMLNKKFPHGDPDIIKITAEERAVALAEGEANRPTAFKKVVVDKFIDEQETRQLVESSPNFLQWAVK